MSKVEVIIYDELEEAVVTSKGELDLCSGKINNVVYSKEFDYYNINKKSPSDDPTYDFTSGIISVNNREIDFTIKSDGTYFISQAELSQIKDFMTKAEKSSPKKKIK